jgi:hypothetical protein
MNHPARYVAGDPEHDWNATKLRIVTAACEADCNIATTGRMIIIEGKPEQLTKVLLWLPGDVARAATWGRMRQSLRWEAKP